MRSTTEVLDHHLKCFAERDLGAVTSDYAVDAVFLGPNATRHVFERMFGELPRPGVSFARKQRLMEGDHAYIVWTSETADNS